MRAKVESFLDIKVPIFDVSEECVEENGQNRGIWFFGDKMDTSNDLIIGMSPTNYHTYFIAGEMEVHPRFAFNKVKYRESRQGSIRAGMFIRIKNVGKEDIEKCCNYLESIRGTRTLSCIEGVRQFLYFGAGITIANSGSSDLYITQLLYKLFKYGLWSPEGKRYEVEVYKTRDKSLDQMFKEICFTENYFLWAGVLSYYMYKVLDRFSFGIAPGIEPKIPAFFDVHHQILSPSPRGVLA